MTPQSDTVMVLFSFERNLICRDCCSPSLTGAGGEASGSAEWSRRREAKGPQARGTGDLGFERLLQMKDLKWFSERVQKAGFAFSLRLQGKAKRQGDTGGGCKALGIGPP